MDEDLFMCQFKENKEVPAKYQIKESNQTWDTIGEVAIFKAFTDYNVWDNPRSLRIEVWYHKPFKPGIQINVGRKRFVFGWGA